jgi:hypothetical protein
VVAWYADADFKVRAALAMNAADGSKTLRVRSSIDAAWSALVTWPQQEEGRVVCFAQDGRYGSVALQDTTQNFDNCIMHSNRPACWQRWLCTRLMAAGFIVCQSLMLPNLAVGRSTQWCAVHMFSNFLGSV